MAEIVPAAEPETGAPAENDRSVNWRVIAALALVIAGISAAVIVGLVINTRPVATGPLPVASVDQPAAGSVACRRLAPALPDQLVGAKRRTVRGGGDGVAAWGDPPVILRCGLRTPEQLNCAAALIRVNGVYWLQISDHGQSTYVAADRSVRVAVTIPDGSGTAAIQLVSDVIDGTLPFRKPCVDGVLLPTDTQ